MNIIKEHLIRKASLVDTFMKYHEDADNYRSNTNGFDKMYKILKKYVVMPDENVDEIFLRAPEEDQKKMIELITPKNELNSEEEIEKTEESDELLETFMEYHEDAENYKNNISGFRKMYEILEQYGNSEEKVSEVFKRAPKEDQERMVQLITPK